MAALTLLDLLLSGNSTNRLYYSGDFDLKGLQIAASFLERYAERCHSWHLDLTAYNIALRADGIMAHENELRQLNMLPPVFSPLVAAMQAEKKWAYQEGITRELIADIRG